MPMVLANWDCDSDLTSLASDDEVEDEQPPIQEPTPGPSRPNINTRPSTKQATAKSQKKARTNPHLAPPRICQYSAHQLHKMLGEGCINLDPEYQRDVVWSPAKQTALIDSLIHNYYMPPIIFAVTLRCDDVSRKMVCIDGKQRLTSIKRFMDGEIPHKDTFSGRKSYYMNGPGQRRKLLTKPEIQDFENQQIACVEYLNLTDEDEREIFQRVQMGVALTPAERMNAINAPYATLARELQAKRQLFDGQLKFQDTQKREYLAILQIIVMIAGEKVMEPKNQKVEYFLAKKDPVKTAVRNAITIAINIFCLLIEDPVLGQPICNSKYKLLPIEYVMAIYLIHLHRTKLSLTQLSDAVDKMREHLRSNSKDPQFSPAFKLLLTFVKGVAKQPLKGDDCGDTPADPLIVAAMLEAAVNSGSNGEAGTTASTPLSSKRKRADSNDSDDESDGDRVVVQRRGPGRPRKVRLDDEAVIKPAPPPKAKTPASRASVAKAASAATPSSSKATTTVKRGASTKIKAGNSMSGAASGMSKVVTQTAKPTIKPSVSSRTKKPADSTVSSAILLPPPSRVLPTPPASAASNTSPTDPVPFQANPLPQSSSHPTPSTIPIAETLARAHSLEHRAKSEPKRFLIPPESKTNGVPAPTGPPDRLAPMRAARQLFNSVSLQQPAVPTMKIPPSGSRNSEAQLTPPLVTPSENILDNILRGMSSNPQPRSARVSTSRPPSSRKTTSGSSEPHRSDPLDKSILAGPSVSHDPGLHAGSSVNAPLNVNTNVDSFRSTAPASTAPPIPSANQPFSSTTTNSRDSERRPLSTVDSCPPPHNTSGPSQPASASPYDLFPHEEPRSVDRRYGPDRGRVRHRGSSRDRSMTESSTRGRPSRSRSRSRSPRFVHRLPQNTPPPPYSSTRYDRWDSTNRNQTRYRDAETSRRGADNRGGRGREVG